MIFVFGKILALCIVSLPCCFAKRAFCQKSFVSFKISCAGKAGLDVDRVQKAGQIAGHSVVCRP